jgi:hypothetical protein
MKKYTDLSPFEGWHEWKTENGWFRAQSNGGSGNYDVYKHVNQDFIRFGSVNIGHPKWNLLTQLTNAIQEMTVDFPEDEETQDYE